MMIQMVYFGKIFHLICCCADVLVFFFLFPKFHSINH